MDLDGLQRMSDRYREVRRAVFQLSTEPTPANPEIHRYNQQKFRERVVTLCDRADLSRYNGTGEQDAARLWHMIWTRNRYAGIKAQIATKEIEDIGDAFDDYRRFSDPSWDIDSCGYRIERAGTAVHDFLNRDGYFKGRQTVGNIPKLKTIVLLARRLAVFMRDKAPDRPVLDFITGGHNVADVWAIHRHLLDIGYTADLTALHLMMDLGFQVVKPDIVLTRLLLEWGWLHQIDPDLPADLTRVDLDGKGKYRSCYQYTKPTMYRTAINVAQRVAEATSQKNLRDDLGWVTRNALRELDIFVVKAGQQPETAFGIQRTLYPGSPVRAVGDQSCSS
ncbi:MAG: hypothetical protein M3552_17370 [Planctomycetota bacterium]|nr:hypothetical protein [Planctomycetota bacterium]